ncbi:ATP-dependent DNA ligase [Actinospongicola halichondriae]|uniref:ATP-dependent DNA ligase n=1 Tax=Actinospongicola halichondriae TaxID=3236844 RepID=UPI003D424B82
MTLLADVVAASDAVAATRKRNEKKAALADLFARLAADEIEVVVGFLTGEVRQGRIGIGWRTIAGLGVDPAIDRPPALTVREVDETIDRLAGTTGPGSQGRRNEILSELFGRASAAEVDFLGRLFVGEMRTGALAGVVTDAIAVASGVKLATVRRAAMLAGALGVVARLALTEGTDAVAAVGLEPLRVVQPMLASTSESVAAALDEVGEASVEWKLDGARIQVHRSGDEVRIYTRNLNDVTDRLPEIVAAVRAFDAHAFVLDGEVLGFLGPEESPQAFQDTMSRFGRDDATTNPTRLVPHFFDVLHLDGVDQIDEPLRVRRERLEALVGPHLIPGTITADADAGRSVLDEALTRGHEGVMVKAADGLYEAGRRGKSWRKVKPVHTLDLVVLGVEWGSGRRRGRLSNIHMGARDVETGELVMVGKTFKGMTDEMLEWQTERFQQLRTGEDGHVVWVRPEQVVEVAVDGAQSSTRYPGGVALRFARVRRYRDDKDAADADTLAAVRALLPGERI